MYLKITLENHNHCKNKRKWSVMFRFCNNCVVIAISIKILIVFLTASKYCGSGLKIDLVVVVLVVLIKLLSNSSPFVKV